MKLTSKDANKLLSELTNDIYSLQTAEQEKRFFVAATVENKEDVRPAYDYNDTKAKLEELETKVMKIKHALNVFNTVTVVPEFNKTIDEMLIYIPQLTKRKLKLSTMKSKPEFERVQTAVRTNFIEYRYINYDLAQIEADYKAVTEELINAQIALDRVNISATFDVEL